jgi:hypothetical protein
MKTRMLRVLVILVALFALMGCAVTRTASFGPLAGDHMLVTLVVSEDRAVVAHECRDVRASGVILGCQMSAPVSLPDGSRARTMKIVRYTDQLPSPLAFEIDVHELCHAVAALQLIEDPCHQGNAGVAQASRDGGAAMIGPAQSPIH